MTNIFNTVEVFSMEGEGIFLFLIDFWQAASSRGVI
jgi:hypothetical protein